MGGDASLGASGNLVLGTGDDVVRLSAGHATHRLWVGADTVGVAPFRVSKAGAFTATDATITGAVTATSGSLGSMTITGVLTAGDIKGNWNGASPADLSSAPDGTATTGFYIDGSAGAAQFMGPVMLGGQNLWLKPAGTHPQWATVYTTDTGGEAALVLRTAGSGGGTGGSNFDGTPTTVGKITLHETGEFMIEGSTLGTVLDVYNNAGTAVFNFGSGDLATSGLIKVDGTEIFHPGNIPNASTQLDGPIIGTWTPTLTATTTNPTLSTDASHTVTGEYTKVGNLVKAWVFIEFGTTGVNAGSGQYLIDTPTTASKPTISGNNQPSVGSGRIFDSDGADTYLVDVRLTDTTHVRLRYDQQTASGNVGAAIPYTWANSDYIVIHFEYLEA